MKKRLLVLFLFCWGYCNAQNEYVNWYFGVNAGLNFCDGKLNITPEQFDKYSNITSATISDKTTGKLLFHTDGQTIWNSQYQIMQNGSDLKGSNESSQGALIVPQPGNDSTYYIFTTSFSETPPDTLAYSIVNMKKNNSLGSVISKNNFLHLSCEQLTAIYNSIENFYWILCLDSNYFLEYKLDESGLSSVPVFYSTNVLFGKWWGMSSGFLKGSPNSQLLACSFQLPALVSLYSFNITTGNINFISDLQFDTTNIDVWGLSFSPNSTKLYVDETSFNSGGNSTVFQFDVSSLISSKINNSQINLYSFSTYKNGHLFANLQLGPDKKIYVERMATDSLTVIDNPDSAGFACNFRFNAISLDGAVNTYSLSNNIDNLYEWAQPPSLSVTATSQGCNGVSSFTITPSKNFNDYEISFGDGADTTLDSLQYIGTHYYTTAGTYTISVKGQLGCVFDSVSTVVTIPEPCAGREPTLIIPTLIYGKGSQTQWHIINIPQGNNKVVLYDELGRIIYATNNYPNDYDMRNLPPAMYFYRLTTVTGQEYTGKIVLVK